MKASDTPFGKFLLAIIECDCDPDAVYDMTLDAMLKLGIARDATPEQYAAFQARRLQYERGLNKSPHLVTV